MKCRILLSLAKLASIAALPLGGGCTSADLVLRHGRVVTVDGRHGEAQAVAVRGDRILAVGSDESISRYIDKDTRVVDLNGRLAIPGFIEGHGHFTSIGETKLDLDLTHAENWDDVIAMVKEAVRHAKPGEWIIGRGWHQEKWNTVPVPNVEGFPIHHALSAVSTNNPVCLTHASGHASFFNENAMKQAGVDESTGDPPGGEILRDASGQPIGLFRERAQLLVTQVHNEQMDRSPESARARLRRQIELADRECLSKGITSFQDAGSSFRTIDVMRDMVLAGEIGTRLWVMIREPNARLEPQLERYRTEGLGNHHLTVRAIKRSIDGALGSRGAWLLEPYTDLPQSVGLNTAEVPDVEETARLAAEHGYQLCIHAIGDRANREVLDMYERALKKYGRHKVARWRIEHAQHLSTTDIPRLAELGVIASMQGIHCTSDAPYVEDRLGPRRAREGAYVWQKLIKSGAIVSNGTDAPVEDVSPIQCFHASVTRRTKDGTRFYPDQCMTRMQALRSYTLNAAYAAFEEDIKGSLTPGKLADITVLSNDILTCPEDDILDTRVIYTIVGGQIRFEADEFKHAAGARPRARLGAPSRNLDHDRGASNMTLAGVGDGR